MKNNHDKSQDKNQKTIKKDDVSIRQILKSNIDIFAILFFVIFAVYFKVLSAGFISGDDIVAFVNNVTIRNIFDVIKAQDLYNFVHSSSYNLFGPIPTPLHFFAVLLHFINSCLLFVFTIILLKKRSAAIITAILFSVHPLASEPVSWVSGAPYLFLTFFIYLTFIFYTSYFFTGNKTYLHGTYMTLLINFITLKYAWTPIIVFLLIILDQIILEKRVIISKKKFELYLPAIIMVIVFAFSFILPESQKRIEVLQAQNPSKSVETTPVFNRAPYTIYMTTELLIFPKNLSLFHEGNVISKEMYIFMILVTILDFGLIIVFLKKNKMIAGFLIMILILLLPTFSPILVAFFIAERYLYAGVGLFCIVLAILITKLEEKWHIKHLAAILAIIMVCLYSLRTFIRTNDWKNSKNLWIATSKISPNSARVYNNIGDAYTQEGSLLAAEESFKKAIELQPDYADAIHNLANTYMMMQRYDEAEVLLKESLKINPRLAPSYVKLGAISYSRGNIADAITFFKKALEIDPNNEAAKSSLETITSQ